MVLVRYILQEPLTLTKLIIGDTMRYSVINYHTDEEVAQTNSLDIAYRIRDMLEGKHIVWDNLDKEQIG